MRGEPEMNGDRMDHQVVVQKYGGTSVADVSCLRRVAGRIAQTRDLGAMVVVVVSAPAGMTQSLIQRACEVCAEPDAREMDMILATGEQLSISLLAMALLSMGHQAVSFTAAQVGIITDNTHNRARIRSIRTDAIQRELNLGKIPIIAGFQGITEHLEITTLGRGGSDITATALGCALGARKVEIYTDVDGIYTADPRVIPGARKLHAVSYEEMLEMAGSGARVLHSRCVELAAKHELEVHLRSSFVQNDGTWIRKGDDKMEQVMVRGIAHSLHEAKITLRGIDGRPERIAELFEQIAQAHVNVDIVVQDFDQHGRMNVSFLVERDDLEKAFAISEAFARSDSHISLSGNSHIGKVSVIGIGMRSHPGVAATVFRALADQKIPIDMVSCSEIKIACVVAEEYVPLALQALHHAFFENKLLAKEA